MERGIIIGHFTERLLCIMSIYTAEGTDLQTCAPRRFFPTGIFFFILLVYRVEPVEDSPDPVGGLFFKLGVKIPFARFNPFFHNSGVAVGKSYKVAKVIIMVETERHFFSDSSSL